MLGILCESEKIGSVGAKFLRCCHILVFELILILFINIMRNKMDEEEGLNMLVVCTCSKSFSIL